jgi:hypothetical protein
LAGIHVKDKLPVHRENTAMKRKDPVIFCFQIYTAGKGKFTMHLKQTKGFWKLWILAVLSEIPSAPPIFFSF